VTKYKCTFKFRGETRTAEASGGVAEFQIGFWLDAELKFHRGMGVTFWNPPHQIEYIEAVRECDRKLAAVPA
jgi:hypothetical protein